MPITKLVILDFSGTLSLAAAQFASNALLEGALRQAGLDRYGITSASTLFEQIIQPTWQRGSTTSRGYRQLLAEQLALLEQTTISTAHLRAADAFVSAYFAHSSIDPAWGATLQQLLTDPALGIVIATDHYFEATEHIILQLQTLGFSGESATKPSQARILIANSAEFGALKSQPRFWQTLQTRQPLSAVNQLYQVDDFGYNEAQSSLPETIVRMSQVSVAIATAFNAPLQTFSFFFQPEPGCSPPQQHAYYQDLIVQSSGFLFTQLTEQHLSEQARLQSAAAALDTQSPEHPALEPS